MSLLLWVLFGSVIGFLSYFLDSKEAKGGLIGSILFGVAGSLIGGGIAHFLFGVPQVSFDPAIFLIAISGALFLLLIHHTIFTKEEKF